MSPRRRSPGGYAPRPGFRLGLLLLWALLIVESIWLAAFIWATGSLIPPGMAVRRRDLGAALQGSQEERKADESLRQMLLKKGSRGPRQAPPAATPRSSATP